MSGMTVCAAQNTCGAWPTIVGTTVSDILLDILWRNGYASDALCTPGWVRRPVYIQSFEYGNLRYIHGKSLAPLVLLIDEYMPEDGR